MKTNEIFKPCPFCSTPVIRYRDTGYVIHSQHPLVSCPIRDASIWVSVQIWKCMSPRETALEIENARLRTALDRYSDEYNWAQVANVSGRYDVWCHPEDGWTIAREALDAKK